MILEIRRLSEDCFKFIYSLLLLCLSLPAPGVLAYVGRGRFDARAGELHRVFPDRLIVFLLKQVDQLNVGW